MASAGDTKFDPSANTDNALESFNEFIANYKYTYEALNREVPRDVDANARPDWIAMDKKRVFLGRHASRGLQKELEAVSTAAEITNMDFDAMVAKFQERFGLQANQTLANFKFRKLAQSCNENFDAFVIRVKDDAKSCKFKCAAAACNVANTLIRDQILIGTQDHEIRRQGLHNEWELDDLIKNGRSMEAATKGAVKIKSEPPDVRRTKPGKYSKKKSLRKKIAEVTCSTCTNTKCNGSRKCYGRSVTCYACNKKGHYKGSKVCKMKMDNHKSSKTRERRARQVGEEHSDSEDSTTDDTSRGSTSESGEYEESESEVSSGEKEARRVYSKIPKARRIAGTRRCRAIRKVTSNKYTTEVIIKEQPITVHADSGADICVMSAKNARKLKLKTMPTNMKIKPYGSKPQKCQSVYIGTIMFGENVTTAEIYVVKKNVETLLSGSVCEDLGILKFTKTAHTLRTEEEEPEEPDEEKQKLIKKFPEIFNGAVGRLKDYEVKFHVNTKVRPVIQPKRPIPFHLRSRLEKELKEMEENDIIEEHTGPVTWLSNLVLAPKDDGGVRVTVDLRNANRAIKPSHIPIPRPEEVRANLAGYKVYSKIDLKSAFHQLELGEESREMTTFYANKRLMRYKRLTMGSTPASGELTKALNPILGDLPGVSVIHDDIIVGADDIESHDETLHEVCRRISEAGMTLNQNKCIIAKESIPWWGMIISKDGISPDPSKVKDIKNLTAPTTKDEVKSFMCFIQSNKDFIPSIANKTVNIRRLLKKHAHFRWTKECQREFETLKDDLREDILMQHFDPSLNTYIYVDAHKTGLSAVLKQGRDEEESRPVAVASRATTDTETRYPQLDLEALAIDFALRRFRFYIAGGPQIKIITDHKPLEAIFGNKRTGSIRTERIRLRHQDLNYLVKWEKGEENCADYLSRHAKPLKDLPNDQLEEADEMEKTVWLLQYGPYVESVSVGKIIRATKEDTTLKKLTASIRKGYIDPKDKELKPYAKILEQLTISDSGIILKENKIILPTKLVDLVIRKAHQGGHPGITSMKRRIRAHFYLPGLNEYIEKAVKACRECTLFTSKNRKNKLHPQITEEYNAWEKLSIDLFGPMPDDRHVVVVQDMVSKFPAARILTKTDANHTISAIKDIYNDYGNPISHRTDNGPPFNSEGFREFSDDRGIRHDLSFPYHPQANPVECLMKPLGKAMKTAHFNGHDKEKTLNDFLATYRATPNINTGISPGDVMFRHGYAMDFPKQDSPDDKTIRDGIKNDQTRRRELDDRKNTTRREESYAIGDRVVTRNMTGRKFDPKFGPDTMVVTDTENGGLTCRAENGREQRRHVDDVRPAHMDQEAQVPEQAISLDNVDEESRTQDLPRRNPPRARKTPTRYENYHMD